jgi:5-hydroxyisourate hydrolase-like protein (transthyretin family)
MKLITLIAVLSQLLISSVPTSADSPIILLPAQEDQSTTFPNQINDSPTVHIQGHVTDAVGKPGAELRVRLMLSDGRIAQETITSANGSFFFPPTQADSYQLWVVADDGRPLVWEGDQLFAVEEENSRFPIEHEIRLREVLAMIPATIDIVQSDPQAIRAGKVVSTGTETTFHDNTATLNAGAQISGTITAASSGAPLVDARIILYNLNDQFVNSAVADTNGRYQLNGIIAGRYKVGFEPGFGGGGREELLPEYYNDKFDLTTADIIELADGERRLINASLLRGGKITGVVTDSQTGLPLDNVDVTLYRANGRYVRQIATDPQGTYTFVGLYAGAYKLEFESSEYEYLIEYYNDKRSLAKADEINVALEQTTSVNVSLTGGARVVGKVTNALSGAPLSGIEVSLYDENGQRVNQSTTSVSGLYTITRLYSGNYRASFAPNSFSGGSADFLLEYYNDKSTLALADVVNLTAPNVATLNAQLTLGGRITGKVTDQTTGASLANIHAEAYDRYGQLQASGSTDVNGAYVLTGLNSGTYWLYFEAPDTGITAVYGNQHHLDAVEVSAGNSHTVDMRLTRLGQISGSVTAAESSLPLANVAVRIFDADGIFVDSVRTTADGVYTTTGLLVGNYTLYFDATDHLDTYYKGKTNLLLADQVQITGSTLVSGIDIALTRGSEINGKVTSADINQPLSAVQVQLYDTDYRYVAAVWIDAAGLYRFPGLAGGSYLLRFVPEKPFNRSATHATRYYQEKEDLTTADLVQLAPAQVVTNINIALPSLPLGQIRGRVIAEDNSQPLKDIVVTAYDEAGEEISSSLTDAAGLYTLARLPNGNYRLHFAVGSRVDHESRFYLPEYYNNRATEESADVVKVTAPAPTENINVALTRGGRLVGTVSAADTGLPLELSVRLYDAAGKRVDFDYTNATPGMYEFVRLAAGDYRLHFDPDNTPYIPVYSGGTADLASATIIPVNTGQTITHTNTALVRGGQISGYVVAQDSGFPLNDVQVDVYDAATGRLVEQIISDGSYQTVGLRNGSYRLRFTKDREYLATDYPTPVTISSPTVIEGINMQLPRGATILGRVMDGQTRQPIGNVAVTFGQCNVVERKSSTNWLGLYALPGLPTGSYEVRFTPDSASAYLPSSLNVGAVNAPDEMVQHQTLNRGGQISGILTAIDSGKPLANVAVSIYDSNNRFVHSTATNSAGVYMTGGLPDGQYRLFFVPEWNGNAAAYIREFYNDQASLAAAQTVTIAGLNRVTGVNATLVLGGRVAGRVTAAESGQALANVDVYVLDQNGFFLARTTSGSDGTYITPGVPDGAYRIHFDTWYAGNGAPYMDQYYNGKLTQALSDPVTVSAPNLTAGINAALQRGGRIAGMVTDQTGQPLDSIYVPVYDNAGRRASYAFTNNGLYVTSGLPPGEYRVGFEYDQTDSCGETSLVRYYSNKASLDTADRVTISGTETKQNINAILDLNQSGTPTPTPPNNGGATPTPPGGSGPTPTPDPSQPTPTPGANRLYLPSVSR